MRVVLQKKEKKIEVTISAVKNYFLFKVGSPNSQKFLSGLPRILNRIKHAPIIIVVHASMASSIPEFLHREEIIKADHDLVIRELALRVSRSKEEMKIASQVKTMKPKASIYNQKLFYARQKISFLVE